MNLEISISVRPDLYFIFKIEEFHYQIAGDFLLLIKNIKDVFRLVWVLLHKIQNFLLFLIFVIVSSFVVISPMVLPFVAVLGLVRSVGGGGVFGLLLMVIDDLLLLDEF